MLQAVRPLLTLSCNYWTQSPLHRMINNQLGRFFLQMLLLGNCSKPQSSDQQAVYKALVPELSFSSTPSVLKENNPTSPQTSLCKAKQTQLHFCRKQSLLSFEKSFSALFSDSVLFFLVINDQERKTYRLPTSSHTILSLPFVVGSTSPKYIPQYLQGLWFHMVSYDFMVASF